MKTRVSAFYIQIIEAILVAFALNLSFVVACKLLYNTYFPVGKANQVMLCAAVTCAGLLIFALDKYFSMREKPFAIMITKLLVVIAVTDFMFIALLYFNLTVRLSPYLFVLTNVVQITLLLLLKLLFRQYKSELDEERKTLVISADRADNQVYEAILAQGNRNVVFMFFNEHSDAQVCEQLGSGLKVQPANSVSSGGTSDKFTRNIQSGDISEHLVRNMQSGDINEHLAGNIQTADVIYLSDSLSKEQKDKIISYCIFKDKNVYLVPETYEIALRKSELTQVGDVPVFNISSFRFTPMQLFMKRALDIIGSLVGLVVLGPVCIAAMILIKREDGASVFFSQTRAGKDGREFKVIKLRTMIPDAEKHTGAVLAQDGDIRITKVGNRLRSMRIDEIPQFINVLKGEMSLVGPRPERPVFVEEYSKDLPEYSNRLMAKPGITGLAQVMGSYRTTAASKAKFDLVYIRNYSFWLDIKILLKTVGVVFRKESAQGICAKAVERPTFSAQDVPWQTARPQKRKSGLLYKAFKSVAVASCVLIIMSSIVVLRYNNLLINVLADGSEAASVMALMDTDETMPFGEADKYATGGDDTASSDGTDAVSTGITGAVSADGTDAGSNSNLAGNNDTNMISSDGANGNLAKGASADQSTYLAKQQKEVTSQLVQGSLRSDAKEPTILRMERYLSTVGQNESVQPPFSSKVNVMYKLVTKMSTEDIFIIEDMSENGFTEAEKDAVRQMLKKYFTQEEIGYILDMYRQIAN